MFALDNMLNNMLDQYIAIDFAPLFSLFIVSITCGIIGCMLAVKRSAMVVDAVGHAVFPGMVLGIALTSIDNVLFILFCGVLSALAVYCIVEAFRIKVQFSTSICIFYTGAFGLGIILMYQFGLHHANVDVHLFYGSIDTIIWSKMHSLNSLFSYDTWISMPRTIIIAVIAIIYSSISLILISRPIMMMTFDNVYAHVMGLPVRLVNVIFIINVAVSAVAAFYIVGIVSALSLYICPSVISMSIVRNSYARCVIYSGIIGGILSIIGYNAGILLENNIGYGFDMSGFIAVFYGSITISWVLLCRILRKKIQSRNLHISKNHDALNIIINKYNNKDNPSM